MMTYNKPYYNDFVERFGLKKEKDLFAYIIDRKAEIDPRLRHVFERMKLRNSVTLRTLNVWRFDAEVDLINDLYNRAWTYNWGFVPLSKEEFQHIAKDMKQIVDPDMVFIAEVNGQPVGFCLSLPNINQALKYVKNGRLFPTGLLKILWHTKVKNKIDSVRVITMGLVPEFQKRGIDTLFYLQTFDVGSRKGYNWAELSWLLEDNDMILRALDHMGGKPYKKYRLYGMRV
jgi:GNAT superfamily N-acetyltransferase